MRTVLCTALLLLLSAPPASARQAFFWTATEGTLLRADYLVFSTADFKDDAGDLGGERSVLAGQYRFREASPWVLALGHEYNALDIDLPTGLAPQTNGDLHTLHAAIEWTTGAGPGELRLALAPALSVSSNGLKNPDELDSDAAQLWASALYAWPGAHFDWILGAAHDFRFGASQVYPVAGIQWSADATLLRLTFPDVVLRTRLGQRWQLAFATEPDGNEWWAYDRDLETADEFHSEAWRSEISLSYQFSNGLRLGLSAGYRWDAHWKFRRENGDWARQDTDSAPFYGIHLGWYRPGDQQAQGS
jgi:hypothetical protein